MKLMAWDVDDVLNNLTFEWHADYCSERGIRLPFSRLKNNPPCGELGVSLPVYLESLDNFRFRRMADMEPRAEVLAWFQKHGASFRHVALTSAPLATAHLSAAWVLKNFGKWARTFHVTPSVRAGEDIPCYDKTKADFLKESGNFDAFIDDRPDNIAQAAAAGIKTFTFPAPWNDAADRPVSSLLEELAEFLENGAGK